MQWLIWSLSGPTSQISGQTTWHNIAQHARTEQSWPFESTSQNAVSPLRNHFSQAPSSECPDAFSDSMWNLAWRSNETNHHEIISLHDVSKVVRVETACGLLPCVGLVSLNLGEVTTDELRHLRNISCSHVFPRFVKTTCWRRKKDVILKKRISCKTELQGPTSSPTISLKLRRGEDVVNLVLHTSEHTEHVF